jgi:hypothetical protein
MDTGKTALITAPEPELDALSFALPEPESVGHWIGRLPMANVPESASQLRQATFEIARLQTDWSTRMALLEGIRPTVQYLSGRLDRLASDESDQSDVTARLAQRLQSNLNSGYRAVIVDLANQSNQSAFTDEARATASLAVHRALTDLSRTLLRTVQFYVAPADRLWLKLNQLYLFAEQHGMQDHVHPDMEGNSKLSLSITGAYLRALLLAMAKPYQLRHRQLAEIFSALSDWVQRVSLTPHRGDTLHLVDLASDQGPAYASQVSVSDPEMMRDIHPERLAGDLAIHLRRAFTEDTASIDEALIQHLVDAWSQVRPRAYGRSPTADPMKICIGIPAIHHFVSGGAGFEDLLNRDNDGRGSSEINPFLQQEIKTLPATGDRPADIWDAAFDVGGRIPVNPEFENSEIELYPQENQDREEASRAEDQRHYDATTADISPGGYRLRWNEPYPSSLQTGELLGLRDESDPRWCLAVIRWLRQDAKGAFMGVELVAPRAAATAIRPVQSRGNPSAYQHALLLPALQPIRQPPSLITRPGDFEAGQKVQFVEDGKQITAQLGECVIKTESFNQFTFRLLGGYLEKPGNGRTMGVAGDFNQQNRGFR